MRRHVPSGRTMPPNATHLLWPAIPATILTLALAIAVACGDPAAPPGAPDVRIVEPATYLSLLVGDTLRLRAEVVGPDGGVPVEGTTLVWVTHEADTLGWGDSVDVYLATAGKLIVVVTATLPDGRTARDAWGGVVGFNGPPAIESVSITPWFPFESEELLLIAVAHDPQSGPVPAEMLRWSSDIDGVFALGDTVRLPPRTLTPGEHTITVRAQDPQGFADSLVQALKIVASHERLLWSWSVPDNAPSGNYGDLALTPRGLIVFAHPTPDHHPYGSVIHAVSSAGELQWQHNLEADFWDHNSALTITADGTIFVVDFRGNVEALSEAGVSLWRRPALLERDPHASLALTTDGALFATARFGYDPPDVLRPGLLRLSPATGEVVWRYRLSTGSPAGPSITTQGEVVVAHGRVLTRTDPDGVVLVEDTVSGCYAMYWAGMDEHGTAYVSDPGSPAAIVALDSAGAMRWTVGFAAYWPTEPVVGAGGVVFASAMNDGTVKRIDPSGNVAWTTSLPSGTSWAPPGQALTADDRLLVAEGRRLYALEVADGSVAWVADLTADAGHGIAVADDGTIFVTTNDMRVTAFRGDAPLDPNAPWPIWRADNQRTARVRAP